MPSTKTAPKALNLGTWIEDDLSYDPYARVMTVAYDGDNSYQVTHRGEGRSMCVKHTGCFHIGMTNWLDWPAVADVIERHRAHCHGA